MMNKPVYTSSIGIILFEIIVLGFSLALLYKISSLDNTLYDVSNQRLQMIQTADRLRQSSDDLSHFARTYVVTKNERFKKQYFQTLGIRDGKIPRPFMYESIYWDLEKKIRETRHPETVKLSLKEIIKQLPFSKEELEKLKLSEDNSNDLVNLEVEAFNALIGKYKDINGTYSITNKSNQQMAINLLHSNTYYSAKHKIMNPIDQFIILLNNRTQKRVDQIYSDIQFFFNIFFLFTTIFIVGNILIYRYLNAKEKQISEALEMLNHSLEQTVHNKTKELKNINITLEKRVKNEVEKNSQQMIIMQEQSRHAQMGEMISMIAHQWRQPLNILAVIIQSAALKYKLGKFNNELMMKLSHDSQKQIFQMSQTIDDFRHFFKPNKHAKIFSVNTSIDDAIVLLKPILDQHQILIEFDAKDDISINGFSNDLRQVLISLLNNAKDVLIEKNEKKVKRIYIVLKKENKNVIISIEDNGGGVPKNIIDKIFDPYFSTKNEKNGTGLGLYMSKSIIEKHSHGTLSVENSDKGAIFNIVFSDSLE